MATLSPSHFQTLLPSPSPLHADPLIYVGAIPVLSHTVVGTLPIYPSLFLLETLYNPTTLNHASRTKSSQHSPDLEHSTGPTPQLAKPLCIPEVWFTGVDHEPCAAPSECCLKMYEEILSKKGNLPPRKEANGCNNHYFSESEEIVLVGPTGGKRQQIPSRLSSVYTDSAEEFQQECLGAGIEAVLESNTQGNKSEGDVFKSSNKGNINVLRGKDKSSLFSVQKAYEFTSRSKVNRNSILGPHPSTFLKTTTFNSKQKPFSTSNIQNRYKPSINHKVQGKMSQISEADEAFIQQFVGLSTQDLDSIGVVIPQQAASSTDWSMCLLACIITDKTVFDNPFAKAMINAWGADPMTSFRQVEKNCYLIEFNRAEDLQTAQLGGPWTYRGDLVAVQQITSEMDLKSSLVEFVAVWVLFLNIPINAFKDEGLILIGKEVGKPVSAPVSGFVNGIRFVKMKILIPIKEPVKDIVKVTHPTLGQIKVYCSYEKVSRICLFCGKLGHEMAGCKDYERLALLAQKPGQEKRFKDAKILDPKIGGWVLNPAIAPGRSVNRRHVSRKSTYSREAAQAGIKRSFDGLPQGNGSTSDSGQHEQQSSLCHGLITVSVEENISSLNKRLKSAEPHAPAPHI